MRQQRQHRKQLKPSDSLQEKSEKLHLLAQKQLERPAEGFESRLGQLPLLLLPLALPARSKKEHQLVNRTSDAVNYADSPQGPKVVVEMPMQIAKTKLTIGWIIPLAFLLPSVLLTLSLWRQISRYRRYKKPQYYNHDTIRKLV